MCRLLSLHYCNLFPVVGCIFGHWSGLCVPICFFSQREQFVFLEARFKSSPCMKCSALQGQKLMQGQLHSQSKTGLSWLTGLSFPELGIVASPCASRVWTAKRGPRSIKGMPGLWLIKCNEAAWLSSCKQKMSQYVLVWTKARNWPSCNHD